MPPAEPPGAGAHGLPGVAGLESADAVELRRARRQLPGAWSSQPVRFKVTYAHPIQPVGVFQARQLGPEVRREVVGCFRYHKRGSCAVFVMPSLTALV